MIKACTDERYKTFNPHLIKQTSMPDNYDQFWNDYHNLTFDEFNKKYTSVGIRRRVKKQLVSLLNSLGLKWKIKLLVSKIKSGK